MAVGSVEPLKRLHREFGDRVHFIDILVRQAHPGPHAPAYRRFEQKLHDAEKYRQDDGVPWPVLVDDVAGSTHQAYGALPSPSYVIDRDGRVAYYVLWTDPPSLRFAIENLLAQGGTGVVDGGLSRGIHPGPTLTAGWPGLARGLPQSVTELMAAAPGVPVAIWLGYQLRPVLAPLMMRDRRLPFAAKALIGAGAAAVLFGAWKLRSRARESQS